MSSLQQDKDEMLEHHSYKSDFEGFTFRKLLIKLTFELILSDLHYHQNFEIIYEFIKVFGDEIDSLLIRMVNK